MTYTYGTDVVIELRTEEPELIASMNIIKVTDAQVSVVPED